MKYRKVEGETMEELQRELEAMFWFGRSRCSTEGVLEGESIAVAMCASVNHSMFIYFDFKDSNDIMIFCICETPKWWSLGPRCFFIFVDFDLPKNQWIQFIQTIRWGFPRWCKTAKPPGSSRITAASWITRIGPLMGHKLLVSSSKTSWSLANIFSVWFNYIG